MQTRHLCVLFHIRTKGYQIKENRECSNMVANILLADTPEPGDGVKWPKINFLEHGHVAYQFKGNHKMQQ